MDAFPFARDHGLGSDISQEDLQFTLQFIFAGSLLNHSEIAPHIPLVDLPRGSWACRLLKRHGFFPGMRCLLEQWLPHAVGAHVDWRHASVMDVFRVVVYWRDYLGLGQTPWSKLDVHSLLRLVPGREHLTPGDAMLCSPMNDEGGLDLTWMQGNMWEAHELWKPAVAILALAIREKLTAENIHIRFSASTCSGYHLIAEFLDVVHSQLCNWPPVFWLRPMDWISEPDDIQDVIATTQARMRRTGYRFRENESPDRWSAGNCATDSRQSLDQIVAQLQESVEGVPDQ